MDRKFVPDEFADKMSKIFGNSITDNHREKNNIDDESMTEHIWINDGSYTKEKINYHFTDPKTRRLYTATLHTWSSSEAYWSVQLSYDNGESDGWYQDITQELRGTYCCWEDSLPTLKIDVIRILKERFPHISGWRDS